MLNHLITIYYYYTMGAGILPVALHHGKIYFLFGRENKNADTPGWSDFGGGKEKSERPLTTAIREGYEELNGFLGSKSQIREMVNKNLIVSIESNKYTTFIFKFQYCEMLPVYFNRNFKFIDKHAEHLVSHNGLYEKSEIKWFTINDIKKSRKQFRNYYDKEFLDLIIEQEKDIKTAFSSK